jgi:hypothetical protein
MIAIPRPARQHRGQQEIGSSKELGAAGRIPAGPDFGEKG